MNSSCDVGPPYLRMIAEEPYGRCFDEDSATYFLQLISVASHLDTTCPAKAVSSARASPSKTLKLQSKDFLADYRQTDSNLNYLSQNGNNSSLPLPDELETFGFANISLVVCATASATAKP